MADRRNWTAAELAILAALYPTTHAAELAAALGRDLRSVYQAAAKRGIAKDKAWIAATTRARVTQPGHGSQASRFRPGNQAWNAGRPFAAGGRSGDTRFKPGRAPREARNWRPVGSTRVNEDGLLIVKVSDDPAVPLRDRWVRLHRMVWERAHGPVPPGMVCVFRPGCATTDIARITPDALELLTRAQLMERNSFRNHLPPEAARLVQLRGVLTRQINRRAKAESETAPQSNTDEHPRRYPSCGTAAAQRHDRAASHHVRHHPRHPRRHD